MNQDNNNENITTGYLDFTGLNINLTNVIPIENISLFSGINYPIPYAK